MPDVNHVHPAETPRTLAPRTRRHRTHPTASSYGDAAEHVQLDARSPPRATIRASYCQAPRTRREPSLKAVKHRPGPSSWPAGKYTHQGTHFCWRASSPKARHANGIAKQSAADRVELHAGRPGSQPAGASRSRAPQPGENHHWRRPMAARRNQAASPAGK